MTTDPRRVEYVALAELKADPRNPKAHDEATIDASIGRFGVLDLIVRDERTGFIVSGHGRHKAFSAMEERGESAPEGVQVAEDGSWRVPVVVGWASRTDTEAGAALIALNRTTELGGWVDDALLDLLDDLGDTVEGFTGVGYGESDLHDLKKYVEGMEIAENFEEGLYNVSESGGDGGEEFSEDVGSVTISGGQVTINVVVEEEDRPRLYALLAEQDFIVDARDSRTA